MVGISYYLRIIKIIIWKNVILLVYLILVWFFCSIQIIFNSKHLLIQQYYIYNDALMALMLILNNIIKIVYIYICIMYVLAEPFHFVAR